MYTVPVYVGEDVDNGDHGDESEAGERRDGKTAFQRKYCKVNIKETRFLTFCS
jgi:hypothetical protein